jgi:hypothetical protein
MIVSTLDFYKLIEIDISNNEDNNIDLGSINMKCMNKKISLMKIIQDLQILSGSVNN